MTLTIRHATGCDLPRVVEITNHYIAETVIHFSTAPWTIEQARAEFDAGQRLLPFLVAEEAGRLVGFARASKWKSRCAYEWAVETGIYLDPSVRSRGIGRRLYAELFDILLRQGYRTIIGGIALPNEASVRLHESMGMTRTALFPKVGYKMGRWIDVAYWTLELGDGVSPPASIRPVAEVAGIAPDCPPKKK